MLTATLILCAIITLALCIVGATVAHRRWVLPWRNRRAYRRFWDRLIESGEPLVIGV